MVTREKSGHAKQNAHFFRAEKVGVINWARRMNAAATG
jgi:hypothetical protein